MILPPWATIETGARNNIPVRTNWFLKLKREKFISIDRQSLCLDDAARFDRVFVGFSNLVLMHSPEILDFRPSFRKRENRREIRLRFIEPKTEAHSSGQGSSRLFDYQISPAFNVELTFGIAQSNN